MDASCQDEVTVGSQDGNGDGGMLQRVGMVERQGGWLAGVVYGKDVLAVAQAVVNTDDIASLALPVNDDGAFVGYGAKLAVHGDGTDGGQQRETGRLVVWLI